MSTTLLLALICAGGVLLFFIGIRSRESGRRIKCQTASYEKQDCY